jgi:hypothetical protein
MNNVELYEVPGGKTHIALPGEDRALCGQEVYTLDAVASSDLDENDLCARCEAALEARTSIASFEGKVVELFDETPDEVKPAKGVKI